MTGIFAFDNFESAPISQFANAMLLIFFSIDIVSIYSGHQMFYNILYLNHLSFTCFHNFMPFCVWMKASLLALFSFTFKISILKLFTFPATKMVSSAYCKVHGHVCPSSFYSYVPALRIILSGHIICTKIKYLWGQKTTLADTVMNIKPMLPQICINKCLFLKGKL